MRALAVDASYSLLKAMDDSIYDTTDARSASPRSANLSLQSLKAWSEQVDPRLRFISTPAQTRNSDQSHHRLVIGNVHLSCLYYFTVLLVARPHLVNSLLSEERVWSGKDQEEGRGIPSTPPSMALRTRTTAEMSQVARSCLDAAVFLLETCHECLQEGFLLRNMCLLQ